MNNVVIKVGKDYYNLRVDDILAGLEKGDGKDKEEDLKKIDYHTGIISVRMLNNTRMSVVVRESKINRIMSIRDKQLVYRRMLGNMEDLSGETVGNLSRYYTENRDLTYRTREGFYIIMVIDKVGDSYRVDKDEMRMSRKSRGDTQGEGVKIIYPNIYDSSQMCWGTTIVPTIGSLKDVGKVTSTFFASQSNNDLSNVVVARGKWVDMLEQLNELNPAVEGELREELKRNVEGMLGKGKRGRTPKITINVYVLIMIGNLYDLDMDWMHNKLFNN